VFQYLPRKIYTEIGLWEDDNFQTASQTAGAKSLEACREL